MMRVLRADFGSRDELWNSAAGGVPVVLGPARILAALAGRIRLARKPFEWPTATAAHERNASHKIVH